MADETPHPIAIIGSACRLPGEASSPSKLWKLLLSPKDLLKEVPRDRFYWEGIYRHDGLHGSSKTKNGYWLDENIRVFDSQFFGINPAEAETIDPQHRLLLENVYEAIESAGLTLEDLHGTDTGVFVGMMSRGYFDNANKDVEAANGQILSTGTSRAMASNRISYTFDFRGPSLTIDTACSSSMMAVHLAVQSLRSRESTVAFACGTNLNLNPNDFISLTKMNMISADGRSKHFDETADGYGRGEGVGVVCLKRLDAALRDGDHIECVIRETGTNQDGHTKGITMPSAEAQAALIRKTYRSAGLDPTQVGSRPSYFEAHGTGTYVGDPLEAEAVQSAFFPPGTEHPEDDTLYIGSIKTIIGHTEGTAGIAGLLRAALAVRYGFIPPSLLYTRMNPRVAPFAKHLRVVAVANPWPVLPVGCPRRASINSFGFGGSNVHVIVESFDNHPHRRVRSVPSFGATEPIFTPFTFSAVSERALVSLMEDCLGYLKAQGSTIPLPDLAWTLQYKRSQFPFRCAISALNFEDLCENLRKATIAQTDDNTSIISAHSSSSARPRIMGIFTGQGSQWAGMGKDLIDGSPYARKIIIKLDDSLSTLPEEDRPSWKLEDELAIHSSRSRINEAALSQPLTTAVQMLLVDLLDIAGVKLHTIVGHSSGEIAAAYAAGLITADDAIRIAYYRGVHSKRAAGASGKNGAMLATFLTPAQAVEFCELPQFRKRIVPAAFNGPSIVTLSGDEDAIDLALETLEGQNIFARKLNIEKAYHSHHVKPCVGPYLQSLEQCGVSLLPPFADSPVWFSSTYPGKRMGPNRELQAEYWVENLKSPVRFFEAVSTAISARGVPNVVLEIGPHSALKKPVLQILGDAEKDRTIYTGLLKRGMNSIVSVSGVLGHVWARFGRAAVNLARYDRVLSDGVQPILLKNLPTYPWLHDREYWWENRFLRRRFEVAFPPNELLGEEITWGAQHETKWRRFLKPKNVPWLMDHKLNGVAVFPGSAYVAMATTAAQRIFKKHSIEMIEVEELSFTLPITFPDEDTAIETVLTFVNIRSTAEQGHAEFVVDFCSHQRQDELMTAAKGRLTARFELDYDRAHPEALPQRTALTDLNPDVFYDNLVATGYNYTGPFKSITSVQRRMDFATGKILFTPSEMTFHPALLDALFQSTFAAENYPGDSAMVNFLVPSIVRSIKIFPVRCDEMAASAPQALRFDVMKTAASEYGGLLYGTEGTGAVMQMDGFQAVPFRVSTPADDLKMFSKVVWRRYIPDARLLSASCVLVNHQKEPALACERVGFFYLRKLNETFSCEEEQHMLPHLRALLGFSRMVMCEVLLGVHDHIKRDWLNDTAEDIDEIVTEYTHVIDMRLLDAVGKAYPGIIRGQTPALSVLSENNMLTQLYEEGLGLTEANSTLVQLVSLISQRSPNMRVLEVGAGTGSATGGILRSATYSSYTFTDVSPAFLGAAKEKFARFADKMEFSVLDAEKDFIAQGFNPGSFEIIVASNVLHALADIGATLTRIRQLLRPGGFLICNELPISSLVKNTMIMGALPGWWSSKHGASNGSPALSEKQWDHMLKHAGFAGVDAITPMSDRLQQSYRVFVAQAVDDRVLALRAPLAHGLSNFGHSLMIIGGKPLGHSLFAEAVERAIAPRFQSVVRLNSLQDLKDNTVIPNLVLSFVELGDPLFQNPTAAKWSALRKLFSEATDVVWVTTGSKTPRTLKAAYKQMMVGLGRTVSREFRDLRLRFVDVDNINTISAHFLGQVVVEWYMLGHWMAEGWHDDVLFPHEGELSVENGTVMVPNVIHAKEENNRYNSKQRRITEDVQPYETAIEVSYSPLSRRYDVREALQSTISVAPEDSVLVKMLYSTLHAIKFKTIGFLFLGLGICPDGQHALVLSATISSLVRLPRYAVFPYSSMARPGKHTLRAAAAQLIAERVVSAARLEGKLLVLTSDALCLALIREKATKYNREVVFITSDPDFDPQNVLFLHHNAMDVHIRQAIPQEVSLFINLSIKPDDKVLAERVCSIIHNSPTKFKRFDSVLRTYSSNYRIVGNATDTCTAEEVKHLNNSVGSLPNMLDFDGLKVISPREISQQPLQEPLTILDWTLPGAVPVTIRPAINTVKFNTDKTYLIIGSSDLARSLCEWMIGSGARHIVLASRNPSSAAGWAEEMSSKGAFVSLNSVDVTDARSMGKMLASIRSRPSSTVAAWPPIAGVIHLGLLLKDTAFSKMTFEDFQIAANVKTTGSVNLHEHLSKDVLDFFILTSSLSYIAGNPGQANYNCGNAFMAGLAQYRRNTGLPASVVHLGHVRGVGYITRTSHSSDDGSIETYRKRGIYPVSERDLHHIYAEAVLASPADSGRDPEIITGLREITPDILEQAPWAKQPFFAHLITQGANGATAQTKPQLSVREKLSEELSAATAVTTSPEEKKTPVQDIVRDALLHRLGVLLQTDVKHIDEEISLLDMGIDSLVASEIGSWARKELRVQIPHSMIFGGASVTDIVGFVVKHLDKGWVMLKGGEAKENEQGKE